MNDTPDSPHSPADANPRRYKEYEDPHYHDEEEDVPIDEGGFSGKRRVRRPEMPRRLPPRRPHYED